LALLCAFAPHRAQTIAAELVSLLSIKGSAFVAKDEMVKVKKQQGRINEE
jgi:hypothetical protein